MRAASLLCAIGILATTPAASSDELNVVSVLQRRAAALARMRVVAPQTLETSGTLSGLGVSGAFHRWISGDRERYDRSLGVRTIQTVRLGYREYVKNPYGDVQRTGEGSVLRLRTADWIAGNQFVDHPETVTPIGAGTLADGRAVYRMRVTAPDGAPFGVALDASSSMIDETQTRDGDGVTTTDYYDYRVEDGALYASRQIESNGDAALDVTASVTSVSVDRPIPAGVFDVPHSARVATDGPVTVPLLVDRGLPFVRATVAGTPVLLLVDSGSQGIVMAPAAAARLHLRLQGTIEIRGAQQTNGAGVAPLDAIDVGTATLPVNVVTVVDLNGLSYEGRTVDGVLGYPLFAAAEVRIDPDKSTLTIAPPASLPVRGTAVPMSTSRQVPEVVARIDDIADGRFVVDTGDSSDLLVFHSFIAANPGVVTYASAADFAGNRGVGGSSAAVPASVDRMQLGPFSLYHRYANVLLADRGAFAEGGDAGNVGYGSLRNFIVTFDVADQLLYLDKTRWFDDGRYRPQYEPLR